jgi:hypothetical protein
MRPPPARLVFLEPVTLLGCNLSKSHGKIVAHFAGNVNPPGGYEHDGRHSGLYGRQMPQS